MTHWSSWFRTLPSQGRGHGFESRMRYDNRVPAPAYMVPPRKEGKCTIGTRRFYGVLNLPCLLWSVGVVVISLGLHPRERRFEPDTDCGNKIGQKASPRVVWRVGCTPWRILSTPCKVHGSAKYRILMNASVSAHPSRGRNWICGRSVMAAQLVANELARVRFPSTARNN